MKQIARIFGCRNVAGDTIDIQISGEDFADKKGDGASIDAGGLLVLPGIIDLGVFAIDKPAFKVGGIVRAALMPDQNPLLDAPGAVKERAASGKPDLWVHPLAAATKGLEGTDLAEIAMMAQVGAKAVATGRRWIVDSGVMEKLMRYCAALDLTLIIHAEDHGLTRGAVANEGMTATLLGLPAAPALAEVLAVDRDIALAMLTGARIHFHQLTTAASFDSVRAAKKQGHAVSCGTSPAYFMLSDHDVADFRTFARLSPPLRCEEDRQAVRAAISDGTVDVLCSAHDPRGPEDKRLPFADAEPGMVGAETLLPMALSLVRDEVIAIERIPELLATNSASLLGLKAGKIEIGFPADLILVDPEKPWQVRGDALASRGNTPFDGLPVQGKAVHVLKGGKLLA